MTRLWWTAPRHRVAASAVQGLTPTIPDAGLLLGRAPGVACSWFTPRGSTRVAVVGSRVVAEHIVFRAVGLGATVTIRSGRPLRWDRLVQAIDVTRDSLAVVPSGSAVPLTGTSSRPVVVLQDAVPSEQPQVRSDGPEELPGAWRCDVTLVRGTTDAELAPVRAADVVLVHPSGVGDLQGLVGIPSAQALPPAAALTDPGRVWVLHGGHATSFALPEDPVEMSG